MINQQSCLHSDKQRLRRRNGLLHPLFVSSVNKFLFLGQFMFCLEGGDVLSLGGLWKAFKPCCFEHQTACLKICSQSGKWWAQSKGKEGETDETDVSWTSWCQVSDFKVLRRGCTAGADKANPEMSWQPWKEIKFDTGRTFVTCGMWNFNDTLMSLSINKLSLR